MDEQQEKKQSHIITSGLQPLQTYSSDMADAVRMNEGSVIKIALAEQKKHEQEELYKKASGSGVKKFFWVLGSILLVGAAIGYSYFLIQKKDAENVTQNVTKNLETFISYDDQAYVDTTNLSNVSQLSNSIWAELDKTAKPGSIKSLFLTKTRSAGSELISSSDFLGLIKATLPSPLARSLGDQFMVGSYLPTKPDAHPHLFFVFSTTDYSIAYAGMLEWEKTLLKDMFTLFKVDLSPSRGNLLEKPFKDIVVNNKDARILYDMEGTDVLYYIFPTKDTFIITDNQDTIREVTTRLLIKKTKPL